MSEAHPARQPGYIDEAEALVGSLFCNTADENKLLYEGVHTLDPQMVADREDIYVGALRILANHRRTLRQLDIVAEPDVWNARYANGLTLQKMQQIRLIHDEAANLLASRLLNINGSAPPCEEVEDLMAGLHEHQRPFMHEVVQFLRAPEYRIVKPLADCDSQGYPVRGAIVEAATGLGKSAMMGRSVMAAGVGKPLRSGERTIRALVVSPSRVINDQIAGLIGDDTFRRFAPPNITVQSFSSETTASEPDKDADVVATTIEQFVKNAQHGLFCGQEFDILLIDEAHQLTEPKFEMTFLNEWRVRLPGGASNPIPTIGFTARTAYDETKDAARLLTRVIKHQTLEDYMQKGVLSGGQFFTLVAEPEYQAEGHQASTDKTIMVPNAQKLRSEALLQGVTDFATPLLSEGRRGIIFCEAGGRSQQARTVAAVLRTLRGLDGRPIRAEALHVWDPGSHKQVQRNLAAYHEGEIDVLTTVGVGQQGLNADFNFVGICGNIASRQKLTQEVGRGMRVSERFPTTVFFHILAGYESRSATSLTFADVFDKDLHEDEADDTPSVMAVTNAHTASGHLKQGAYIGPMPVGDRVSRIRQEKDAATIFDMQKLPRRVQWQLEKIKTQVSQEVNYLINGKVMIPEGHIAFGSLFQLTGGNLTPGSAKRKLDYAGYSWVGKVEEHSDGTRSLERFYEPAAESFFSDNPVPPKASTDTKTAVATAEYLDISEPLLAKFCAEMETTTPFRRVLRLNKVNTARLHYGPDALAWLEGKIAQIPWQEGGDRNRKQICEELGIDAEAYERTKAEVPDFNPIYKRCTDRKGFLWFFSAQQVAAFKAVYVPLESADKEWSFVRIANAANVEARRVATYLSPEEVKQVKRLRANSGQKRELKHLPHDLAQKVVKRIVEQQCGVRAHLMPYVAVAKITKAPAKLIPAFVDDAVNMRINGKNYQSRFIGWQGFKKIIVYRGWREQEYEVDFGRLPSSADDTDYDRQLYARSLQLQWMTAAEMGNPDGIID